LIDYSTKRAASSNNVFTLRASFAVPRSAGSEADSIEVSRVSKMRIQRTHPFTQPQSRPAEIVLFVRLEQLKVNGRREHGNVICNSRKAKGETNLWLNGLD